MGTESTPATPQAGNAGDNTTPQPQAGTPTPEPQAGDGTETISLDEAKKLRSESANLRKRLKAYEDKEQAERDAALSEVEQANKRTAAAEAQLKQYKQELVNAQVKLAAQAKGIINPELLAPYLVGKLEYDDKEMPTNLEKVLNDLLTQNPHLVQPSGRPAPTAGGATSPSRQATTGVGQITLESIAQLTNEQYSQMTEAQRAEVTRVLLNRGRR